MQDHGHQIFTEFIRYYRRFKPIKKPNNLFLPPSVGGPIKGNFVYYEAKLSGAQKP